MSRRGRVLLAAVAVLLLAAQGVAAALLWQHTRPRLPPAAAMTDGLEQAIAAVVGATGDRAAVAISGLVPYTACENTVLARGSRYNRSADLYTDPGGEGALIDHIAAGLPGADRPERVPATGAGPPALVAHVGTVQIRVSQLGQGWVEAFAESGCRGGRAPAATPPVPDSAAQGTIARVLAAAGTGVQSSHVDSVGCPTGRISTVSALSRTTDTGSLPTRLAGVVPAGAHRFGASVNRLAWRDGEQSVIVAASDDGTHLTVEVTTTC